MCCLKPHPWIRASPETVTRLGSKNFGLKGDLQIDEAFKNIREASGLDADRMNAEGVIFKIKATLMFGF